MHRSLAPTLRDKEFNDSGDIGEWRLRTTGFPWRPYDLHFPAG